MEIIYRVYESILGRERTLKFSNFINALRRAASDHESGNIISSMTVNGQYKTREDILRMCRQYKLL